MVKTRNQMMMRAEESSCSICELVDNDEMVQCDMWFHFICVGVEGTTADKDWKCNKCNGATAVVGKAADQDKVTSENETFQSQMNAGIYGIDKVGSKSPSVVSKTPNNIRRDLKMRRLEEHKINMLFVQRKYAIMEAGNNSYESDGDAD